MKKKFLCILTMILVLVQSVGIVPARAASSENTTISFNNSSTSVNVSGYDNKLGTLQYQISGTLTFSFGNKKTNFNRYSFNYTTESYIKGCIYYRLSGSEYTEEFYLEPGTNTSFASFIDGYLDEQQGTRVTKVTFTPIKTTGTCTFGISTINTTYYNLPDSDSQTVYLENDCYKIGIALFWGGGMNYIEDKYDGDNELSNLLNHHDSGRLVQQSYYGTTVDPYVSATYGGNDWPYNPVQGGDQYGNKSKLIDFEITSTYIYVKSRPLDWAQNNQYTISYMENYYIIEDDYIRVDNRFIDFSDYTHSARHQELPAFYTISYLDKFSFYNGNSPWTNGTITEKENLAFWGGNSDAYFTFNSANTETWCAWTSSETDYGIGLYTPDADILLAGRFEYSGSKSAADNGTNYVAPLKTFAIQNYEAFEYSYIITTGSTDEMRDTIYAQRNFESGESLNKYKLSGDATNGTVHIENHADDTYISSSVYETASFEIAFTPNTGYVLESVTRSDGAEVEYTLYSANRLVITDTMPSYDVAYNVIFVPIFSDATGLTMHSYSNHFALSGFAANSTVETQLELITNCLVVEDYLPITLLNADGSAVSATDPFVSGMYFSVNELDFYTAINGDTTADGTVNIADAMEIYKYLQGKTTLENGEYTAADIYADNKVNIVDVITLINQL